MTGFLILSLILSGISAHPGPAEAEETIALVGGTVIDVSNWGSSTADLHDAVVLIEGDKISAVGKRGEIALPDGAKIIDAQGKYIVPGLIDGFGAVDNQAYANAYLYMGVTSVIALSGMKRAPRFENPDPGPRMFTLGYVAPHPWSTEDVLGTIEKHSKSGADVVLLMYGLDPQQLKLAVEKAHELGMSTIGELGYTSYKEAVGLEIDAFVHTQRYSHDLAPPDIVKAIANDHHGMKSREHIFHYQQLIIDIQPDDPRLVEHASVLGGSGIPLMPTLSLYYLAFPENPNPWNEPVAAILNPDDVHRPANPKTGKVEYTPEQYKRWNQLAAKLLMLDQVYYQAGSKYLAGSGADLLGAMPGISLHQELMFLGKVGLPPRETIAAATSNYSQAFGWKDVGLVEPGRFADILVVEGNPLEGLNNLRNISILMKGGEIIDRGSLLK